MTRKGQLEDRDVSDLVSTLSVSTGKAGSELLLCAIAHSPSVSVYISLFDRFR